MRSGEASTRNADITIIEPPSSWVGFKVRELWQQRELLYFLTWRDILVRYKQTAIGAGWAVLQPLMTMLVFSLFFGRLAKMPSDGVPYPVFSLAGLVPWTFFANGVSQSSNSLVANANLLTKVYFPRLMLPMSSLAAGLVDLVISVLLLAGMMLSYGIVPDATALWFPFFILIACITALGVGFWMSAISVQYRDVRYVTPFLMQFWMFATPIVYPSSLLSEPWRTIYGINPMAGVVEGIRWSLLGSGTAPGPMLAVSVVAALGLLLTGTIYFRRMEAGFGDVV